MTLEDLAKVFRPLRLAIVNLASRAIVNTVDDSKNAQAMQVEILKGEVRDVERLQNYGFTSSPKQGAEAVVLRVGGKSDHTIVIICEDRRYRLSLDDGEVALYDFNGSKVHLKKNGDMEIAPSSGKLTITGDVEVTGDAKIDGDTNCAGTVTGSDDCVGGGKSLKGHVHSLAVPATVSISTSNAVVGSPSTASSATGVSGSTAAPT